MLKRILTSPWLYHGLRCLFAAVFIYAGVIKLGAPREFAKVVSGYGLVPESLLPAMSYALPALEVATGIGLLLEIKGCLAAVAAMTVIFIGVLAYGIKLGLDVDCGCYGPHDPEGEAYAGLKTALVRDVFLLAGVVYLYVWRSWRKVRLVRPLAWLRRSIKPTQEECACEK
jgi:uncharacterized membrane protein YphA (DoxX/SURF4 family)